MSARGLVVAKAPVPGRAKTRLGADVGAEAAADLAAAALLDTLDATRAAFGPRGCIVALSGDLSRAARADEIVGALEGWEVVQQRGDTLAERLAHAHADVSAGGAVVQIGMDTPQISGPQLLEVATRLDHHDAVLGPAEDGGWWVLGLRDPARAAAVRDVEMSTRTTYDDTLHALRTAGLDVATAEVVRDVDTVRDADAVASLAPYGRFARAWQELDR